MIINPYKLTALETGRFALDGGAMFGVVPKNLWSKYNPPDDQNRISLALRCLLLTSNDRKIIIDTGIGDKFDQKWQDIYKIDLSEYTLAKSLSAIGIRCDEITDVILTHLHFDHCGGTSIRKSEDIILTFPNARYYVQKKQWDWAQKPSVKDKASFLPENYSLLMQSGLLNLIDGPGKLFPGVESLVMNGHTPGMQVIKISDSDNTILFCTDLIPTTAHVPLPWVMAYDNHPLETIAEKSELLPLAVAGQWYLFFEHDPSFCAGIVQKNERGFMVSKLFSTDEFNRADF